MLCYRVVLIKLAALPCGGGRRVALDSRKLEDSADGNAARPPWLAALAPPAVKVIFNTILQQGVMKRSVFQVYPCTPSTKALNALKRLSDASKKVHLSFSGIRGILGAVCEKNTDSLNPFCFRAFPQIGKFPIMAQGTMHADKPTQAEIRDTEGGAGRSEAAEKRLFP